MRWRLLSLGVLLTTFLLASPAARADEALWAKLRDGGYVLLIRHASTVAGTGDPPGFRLDDCGTQRNLSAAGREEARRLGRAVSERGIPVGIVRSSPWCRCLETARLAFGRAEAWNALRSLYNDSRDEAAQRAEVAAFAVQAPRQTNLVLVTHNFNIRSLTGVSPAQAEIVVARAGADGLQLVGRLPPP